MKLSLTLNMKVVTKTANNKLNKENVKQQIFQYPSGCGKRFNRQKTSVTEHNLEVHSVPSNCCSQTYDHIKSYKMHLNQSHHNYQCDACDATFHTKKRFNSHKKSQHETIPKQCPQCISVVKNVDSHINQVHTNELIICTVCTYTIKYKQTLEDHVRIVHNDETKGTCHSCGETYKRLNNHLMKTKCGTGKQT